MANLLYQQIEQITVSHQALDADMLSWMWTSFQSPFRPSAGFLVTTVFLERQQPVGLNSLFYRVAVPLSELGMRICR